MLAHTIINLDSVTWVDVGMLVAAVLTFGAIGAGVVVAWVQLGTAAKAQQGQADAVSAQHLMNIVSKWGDKRLEDARKNVNSIGDKEKLFKKLKKLSRRAANEKYYKLLRVSDFFEELGIQVSNFDFITVDMVDEILGSAVTEYWKLYEPFITWAQREFEQDTLYQNFRNLAKDVLMMRKKKADSAAVG